MERDGPAPGTFRKYVRRRRPWLNSQSHPLLRTAGTPMPDASPMPIFDGHNDVLLRLIRKGAADVERHFIDGDGEGHLDLPRMTAGGFAGGLFAVFVPSPSSEPDADPSDRRAARREAMSGSSYSQIGRAACRERVWPYVWLPVVGVALNKKKQ